MGIFVAALLIFGAVAAVTISSQKAYAAVTMTTSGDKIFGSNFVRVLITDTSLQGSPADTINVSVEAKHGSTSLGTANLVLDEIGTSGSFEGFVTTQDTGVPVNPTQSLGAEVSRIFPGAVGADNIDATLSDGDSIVISYGGATHTVSFASTIATLTTDRTTAGNEDLITARATDQDANNDPTAVDSINATGLIQAIVGTTDIADIDPANNFTETGQNTNVFELTFAVDVAATATTAGLDLTGNALTLPQGVSFKFQDHKVYDPATSTPAPTPTPPFDAPITTTNQPAGSVTLQNSDGLISLANPVTLANGIQIRTNDPDRNLDTQSTDELAAGNVTVTVEGVAGTVNGTIFEETGDNTGMFQPELTDNRIAIILGAADSIGPTSITLTAATISGDPDITITYTDPFDFNNAVNTEFKLVTKLLHSAGSITAPATAGITDTFAATINDNDLNTNKNTAETYIVTFPDNNSTADRPIANGAGALTLKVKGSEFTWDTALSTMSLNFIETGPDTGMFTASNVDMSKINAQVSGGLKDGDQVKFTYTDNMESPSVDSDTTVTIGKPPVGISVDRTTVPLPIAGSPAKVKVQITDTTKNTNTGSTDAFSFLDTGITVTKSDGTTVGGAPGAAITGLSASKTFTETGLSTGVFTATYTLDTGGSLNLSDLNGAKVKFTYTSGSNSESVSITLKAYDGVLTANVGTVANGVTLIATVNDQDGNKDPATKETVTITGQGTNDDLTLVSFTLDETDLNTGVFTTTIVIGSDLRIVDLATNQFSEAVEFHYNDDVASDSTTNVDRELIINVGTTSGTVTITPEIVGPGTKVTILTDDKDLNANPDGVDTTSSTQEFLRITSDRSGVNTLSSGITGEETGPNTGTFKTTLTLSPLKTTDTLSQAFGGSGKDITGKVLPGDLVQLRYTDQSNAAGNKVTVAKTFKIVSVDPEFKTNLDTVQAGESFTLSISDTDANTDGDAVDSVKVRVTSTSDPVGYDVTALETGPNTGVFTATVTTTTTVSAGSITVRSGDLINLKYNDKYPADFADRVKTVVDPSKDFSINISVGTAASTKSTTPSKTVTQDITGRLITEVKAGQQVLLGATIHNNEDTQRIFVAIIQVEDANGIVVSIGAVGGIAPPNDDSPVAVSFTPDASGNYTVKVFVLSSFATPTILAIPSETTLNVR